MWFAEWLISIITYPIYWFWKKASAYREEGKKGSIILLFTLSLTGVLLFVFVLIWGSVWLWTNHIEIVIGLGLIIWLYSYIYSKIEKNQNQKEQERQRVLDEGQLCVGTRYVMNSLSLLKTTKKPVIVLAQRGLDLLNSAERKKLLHIFKDYNVCLYLCGHSHDLWCDESFNIPQITVGCIKQQNGVKAGFSIGEYDEFGKKISITAYSWENDMWKEYNHFDSQGYQKIWELDEKFCHDENEFINEIKIVINGVVREFQCKVLEMEHSVNHGSIISTIAGKLKAQIKNNDYSKEINFGDRFILSQNVWKVIGVDNTSKRTITITCEKELINRSKDDMENGIANFDKIR